MTYTIKIEDSSLRAKGLIKMLKELKEECNFIEIIEDSPAQIDVNIAAELESRYASFLKDKSGKDWDDLKKELL
ncbi:MAG: hypothetical protein ACOYOT_06610 [Bacteroidales bacterium]